MITPSVSIAILASLSLALTTTWSAAAEKPEKPARQLRLIPVGDSPPFMHEVRDGVSRELDPPPGEVPPQALVIRSAEAGDARAKEPPLPISLHLNRISQTVGIPGDARSLAFERIGGKPAPWLVADLPADGDALILLWRDPKVKNWNKAAHLTVPDGASGTPAGSVRIINTFPAELFIHWRDEKLRLNPGATFTRTMTPGEDAAFEILSAGPDGGTSRYYSSQITQNPGERGFIIIYRADGESPRRPLKVLVLREPVPVAARNEKQGQSGG